MKHWWVLLLGAALLAGSAATWVSLARDERLRGRIIDRLKTTSVYAAVSPVLRRHRNDLVESVTVHPESVCVRLLIPVGGESRFTFTRHGMDSLSPETLRALAVTVTDELPEVGNVQHYRLRRHADLLPDGRKSLWYEYTIRPRYRQRMLRRAAG